MSFYTTQFPYSTVVKIDARFPDGNVYSGSGVLIGPDEVLTAAHLVWKQGVGTATNVTLRRQRQVRADFSGPLLGVLAAAVFL